MIPEETVGQQIARWWEFSDADMAEHAARIDQAIAEAREQGWREGWEACRRATENATKTTTSQVSKSAIAGATERDNDPR